MPLSEDDKRAYNDACKNNFHAYNRLIHQIEQGISETNDYPKTLETVKKLQRDLVAKNTEGHFVVQLFGKGESSTRSGFLRRLEKIFVIANSRCKEQIYASLKEVDKALTSDSANRGQCMEQLKATQKIAYSVPRSDSDKEAILQGIQSLFDRLKPKSTLSCLPTLDPVILSIQQDLTSISTQIAGMGLPVFSSVDYLPEIKNVRTVHTALKELQKKIHDAQQQLKELRPGKPAWETYTAKLNAAWDSQSQLWHHRHLKERSNFCENVSAANFQYFDGELEKIEAQIEHTMSREEIKYLNSTIKLLDERMNARVGGYPERPLKRDQIEEISGRMRACKKNLQRLWEGMGAITANYFNEIARQISDCFNALAGADSKHGIETIKQMCRELHQKRKAFLQQDKLSPGQNHQLMKDLNSLYRESTDLGEKLQPLSFSYEWLADSYQRAVQNSWVIFTDDVPPIR